LTAQKRNLLKSGFYHKSGEDEQKRYMAFRKRIQRIKNIYLGIAAIIIIVALGVGFLVDRNLGLVVVIVAALIVFAGAMYVYYIFKKEMG